jgi:hypothetical protein
MANKGQRFRIFIKKRSDPAGEFLLPQRLDGFDEKLANRTFSA